MAEPVRWGFLSTARINRALLPGFQESTEAELLAVASRDAARADAYGREHAVPRPYGSYEALLEDPDVEAVYISLPNGLHVEWSIRALEAGKHVLCEKPLDRRPARVARAFDVADERGLILMEAFMYRHHPQTKRLAELVDHGLIGELRLIRASFSFLLDRAGDVRLRPELDGGALMDVGCYCVSGARLLAGEPELAIGRQILGETGVDLRFVGTLLFPDEVPALIDCGFDLPLRQSLEAVGSDGTLVVPSPWLCRDPHLLLVRGDERERFDVEDVDRYALQLENMSRAIRGTEEPLLGRDDALGQARTIDALYRSAAADGAPAEI